MYSAFRVWPAVLRACGRWEDGTHVSHPLVHSDGRATLRVLACCTQLSSNLMERATKTSEAAGRTCRPRAHAKEPRQVVHHRPLLPPPCCGNLTSLPLRSRARRASAGGSEAARRLHSSQATSTAAARVTSLRMASLSPLSISADASPSSSMAIRSHLSSERLRCRQNFSS